MYNNSAAFILLYSRHFYTYCLAFLIFMIRKLLLGMACLCIAIAAVAQAGKTPVTLTKLCDGIYVHTTWWNNIPANGIVAETAHGVVLVDTGWDTAQTRQLLQLVAERLHKPVQLCIISHCHADRLGGAAVLQAQHIKTVSLPVTARLAIKEGYTAPEGVLPADNLFTVDGLQVHTYYPGAGHSRDNIVVWFPAQRVLFGGCFIKSTEAADLGNVADADLQAWPLSVKKVQVRFPQPQWVVPGHQSWADGHGLAHTLKLLQQLPANNAAGN